MLVRGPSLERSMSHYLIEQIEALPNVDVRTGSSAVGRRGRGRAPAAACASATPTASEPTRRPTPASCSSAPRRAPTGSRASSRATSAASSSGPDAAGRRLAAQARAATCSRRPCPGVFVAGDVRARSIKRVASAVGEGSMAVSLDPRVPRRRMSATAAVTLAELRAIDLFDDLDDEQLGRMAARSTQPLAAEPGEHHGRAGRADAGRAPALRGHVQTFLVAAATTSSRSAANVAPTWMGAIAVLTERRARRARAAPRPRCALGARRRPTTSAGSRSPSRRCTGA